MHLARDARTAHSASHENFVRHTPCSGPRFRRLRPTAMTDAIHSSTVNPTRGARGPIQRALGFEQDDTLGWVLVAPISLLITLGIVVYIATLGR